jgi:hypothetical protein
MHARNYLGNLDLDVRQDNRRYSQGSLSLLFTHKSVCHCHFGEVSYLHLPNIILSERGSTARTFPVANLKVPLDAWRTE